jgi:hypothetical protein
MFHSLVDTINLHKPAYVQSTDPSILTGFQGAGVGWIDTSLGSGSWAFKIRNNANTGWEVISGGGGGITSIGNTTPTTLNSIIYGNDTVTGNVSIGAGLEFIGGVLSSTVSGGYSTLYGGNDITITGASGDETISFTNTTGYITESALSTLQGALIAGSGISISGDTISSTIVGGITTLYGGTDISITGTDTINFTGTIPTLIGGNDITVISAGGYDTISFINSTGYSTITPVQSDWNETLTSALDYIKNKPSIPTQGLTSLVGGAGITINNSGTTDTISTNLIAGSNVTITSGTGGDTISAASSSGITQLYAGNGITISGTDTISTNLIAGSNVTITSGTGGDTISANGNYLSTLYGGTGISITGTDTITNTLPAPASPNTAYNQNFYTSIPLVDATPGVAGSNGVSYGDHVHPTDTSRQSALTAGQLAAITLVLAGL